MRSMPSSGSGRKETVMSSAMSTEPPRSLVSAGPGSAGSMALAEDRDGLRHQRRAGTREGGQSQPPAAQAGDGLELGLRVGQAREDDVGVVDEHAAGVGQSHAARVALHQRRAGLPLEGRDLLGHRGLRVGEGVGRGRERALRGDLAQHAHATHIKHKASLSVPPPNGTCSHITPLASCAS
jgi:hypothetical protein